MKHISKEERRVKLLKRMEGDRLQYREVKCPWCGHIFMWEKHGAHDLESSYYLYRLKATDEGKSADCVIGDGITDKIKIQILCGAAGVAGDASHNNTALDGGFFCAR